MKIDSPSILNQLTVSGSVEISGSLTISGSILATTYVGVLSSSETGSLLLTASINNDTLTFTKGDGSTFNLTVDNVLSASYVDFTNIDNIPTLVSGSSQISYSGITDIPAGLVSGSSQISYSGITDIPAGLVSGSSQIQLSGIFGTTFSASNFTFPQDLIVQGKLTAQEFNTELISSSIIFESGSTKFGDSFDDVHSFTGSLEVQGTVSATTFSGLISSSAQVSYTGLSDTPAGIVSGSTQVKALLPAGTVSGSVQVAINSTTGTLDVNKGGTGQTTYTNGQLLIGNTTGNTLAKATLTGTSNQVTVTNGAGSITLSTPQNTDTSANFRIGSLGVGTAASGTTGEIRATNEITAFFSDDRLKNRIDKIGNALEKVNQLNGYYFFENDLAKSLGYNNDKLQVGVSAQEVQAVLPEVVAPAPVDDKYLTVRYEKLIPLLIEAIKEQDVVIKQLISDIDSLKSKLNDRGN
jgi:hypothetical protein